MPGIREQPIKLQWHAGPWRKLSLVQRQLHGDNVPSSGVTIDFTGDNISFTVGGTAYSLAVPNAKITFSPSATCTSTTFETVTHAWMTTVPTSGDDEIFLTGPA